jgi:hypothetical protein
VQPFVVSRAISVPAAASPDAIAPLAGHGNRFCTDTNCTNATSIAAIRAAVNDRFCPALIPRNRTAAIAIMIAAMISTTAISTSVNPWSRRVRKRERECGFIAAP